MEWLTNSHPQVQPANVEKLLFTVHADLSSLCVVMFCITQNESALKVKQICKDFSRPLHPNKTLLCELKIHVRQLEMRVISCSPEKKDFLSESREIESWIETQWCLFVLSITAFASYFSSHHLQIKMFLHALFLSNSEVGVIVAVVMFLSRQW